MGVTLALVAVAFGLLAWPAMRNRASLDGLEDWERWLVPVAFAVGLAAVNLLLQLLSRGTADTREVDWIATAQRHEPSPAWLEAWEAVPHDARERMRADRAGAIELLRQRGLLDAATAKALGATPFGSLSGTRVLRDAHAPATLRSRPTYGG